MKKGSALLIVLGMLSFMLFSGIAFSVYMRQTRLPSSFLRRTSITRQLAKAALAEAAESIDRAIGDDPHPGVRRSENGSNYWNHRVLVGNRNDAVSRAGYNGGDTISTLTLEGLAYVPPSLINEARYYSRHTQTARWHKFRFDAGRYAYTAIDVSDYFDVNRALADRPRSSAASRRVTLAHIFEQNGNGGLHGQQVQGAAGDWDEWLDTAGVRKVDDETDKITFGGCMPLVSVADFNLLMADKTFGKVKSPFVEFLKTNNGDFYPDAGKAAGDEQAEAYRAMSFVTDSYFREALEDEYDLEKNENQPFDTADLKSGNLKLPEVMEKFAARPRTAEYSGLIGFIGASMLFDYLDQDSVPLSLTIPTVEKNPMICAIDCSQFKDVPFTVKRDEGQLKNEAGTGEPDEQDKPNRTVSQTVTYSIGGEELETIQGSCCINALAVYPFRHVDNPDSYTLDGKLSLFLCRNGKKPDLIGGRRNNNGAFVFGNTVLPKSAIEADSIIAMPLSGMISVPQSVKTEEEALTPVTVRCKSTGTAALFSQVDGKHWVKFTYVWQQTPVRDDEGRITSWTPEFSKVKDDFTKVVQNRSECRLWPIDEDGNPVSKDLGELFNDFKEKKAYSVCMSLALRVRNTKAGKTVDLVPASVRDDCEQGLLGSADDVEFNQYLSIYYGGNTGVEGLGRHIMRFDLNPADGSFVPGAIEDSKKMTLAASPAAVMVADPRFNHNPANWFICSGAAQKSTWLANCQRSGRDGDIFMGYSDQGYLQSIYELALLPRLTNGDGNNQSLLGNFARLSAAKRDGFCESFGQTQQSALMWNTYRAYRRNGLAADRFADLGFVSGLKGLKVNPFSDSPEVLSAAFANTPQDWCHASTNAEKNIHCDDDAYTFNAKYAWNAYGSPDSRISWERLQDIADDFRYGVQDQVRKGNCDWEKAFENLDWENILGESKNGGSSGDSKIYSVDRKFLYGFWRDCFAANQQLFLVFVRAEPMMMGGGVAGNAPPQLSSRAVALIWRDPEPRKSSGQNQSQTGSDSSYIPHSMRVLFYHPLD